MTEPTELMPCPFCGAAAHFEMDEGRWEWVECESCGMQGNRSASLMEDCKPKLAEAWNRRTPAPVGVEPIGVVGYTVHGAQYVNWLSKAPAHGTPIYTAPQPTQPPIECNTEELKKAYAFGWWSALEAAHGIGIKGGQHDR